jgi:hypothetical protein
VNVFDSTFKAFQQANREHLHSIWRRARDGQLDGLSEEERQLGKIMLDHSDEYFNQFEFADVLADREFDPASEVNPFLHITLHAVIEKQVSDRDPMEALQFYNAMLHNRCSRHEAIHLLMTILIKFLFPVLKRGGKFDLEGYRKLLRICKTRKPDKIIPLLESEPDSSETEEVDEEKFQIFDELRSALRGQAFESIDEAQAFAEVWMKEKNAEPLPEFFGLSPEQMNRILYRPFTETSDIVTLNKDLSGEKVLEIPIVKEAIYFLRRLGELQPLKATAKGNLPRAFASEIHDRFPEDPECPYPIASEQRDMKLLALRHILDMCGWIKKQNQKFYLTKRGQSLNEKGFSSDDFHHLFQTYTQKFNWVSRDLYPQLGIIQQAFLFSCYILFRKAKTSVSADELSTYFIQAFPTVLNMDEKYLPPEEPYQLAQHAFCVRFIERFCEYFGLVTIEKKERRSLNLDYLVRTTPFFDELFQWKL